MISLETGDGVYASANSAWLLLSFTLSGARGEVKMSATLHLHTNIVHPLILDLQHLLQSDIPPINPLALAT